MKNRESAGNRLNHDRGREDIANESDPLEKNGGRIILLWIRKIRQKQMGIK